MSPKLLNIFLLMLSGVLYFFVITPIYTGFGSLWTPKDGKGIVQLRQSKAKYTVTLEQVGQIITQAENLKKDYLAVPEEDKAKLKQMVPSSVDRVRLLSEITNIGNQSGITLNDLNVTELKSFEDKVRGAYSVSFSVKTSYPRFKEIITNFETSLRLFSTESVAFSAPEKESNPITFNVRMMTYFMK